MVDLEKADIGEPFSTESEQPDERTLVRAVGISKGFHGKDVHVDVLRCVDLDLNAGETMAVVGASGIGKSTLLHILGTLERPDDGQLFFQEDDVFRFDDARLANFRNRSIGFVFQFHHLLPEFTALENAMMPCLIQGMAQFRAAEMAEEMLVRVGLGDRLKHRAGELSGGEQQRVALGRALVLQPFLLLADEPTGNLDTRNSDKIHELMMQLNEEMGMTLVVVTHNLELASLMSRTVTITDGKLVENN